MKLASRMEEMCFGMSMALGILFVMPARAAGPLPVDLGEASGFVLLARSSIFNAGATAIVGDIGLSPSPAKSISGFALTLDTTGTFSTSLLVDGRVFADDYAKPTPVDLTVAVGDMTSAYFDAAGRSFPDFTGLYGGVLSGQTLAPGLYKWDADVSILAGGVTLAGGPTDVWIFQIGRDLWLEAGGIVTLAGGPSAANIFWQVTGRTYLGASAQMKGIVLCADVILMSAEASLLGRALARTHVSLDANTIYIAPSEDWLFADGFATGDTASWSSTIE